MYDRDLETVTEFNKWASSSASTIMALLPTLMSFAPIITANIGFLCHLSTTQGFIAAAFTFGLPVHQRDTWKLASIRVKNLLVNQGSYHGNIIPILRPFKEVVDILLAPIKREALLPGRPRYILIQLLRFFFGFVQAMLIWCLLFTVPAIDSFYLMWLCKVWGSIVFSLWLGGTFVFLGWLRARFEKDSFQGDEVIYIRKASTTLDIGNCWRGYWRGYCRRLLGPHPMIVILRPSNDASEREPCWTNQLYTHYFMGMFQLFWICFLSFLFSSTIEGVLFRTLLMVVAFVAIVGVSRGLSILVCCLAQKYLDLRVIEYDNLEEKRMMQRLLGGLPGVLLDIRWMSYRKTQLQESIKMYQLGHHLNRGNVIEVPNSTEQCVQHARKYSFMDQLMRLVGVALTITAAQYLPDLVMWDPLEDPSYSYDLLLLIRATIMATPFISLYLGRTRRLLICNCG